MNSRVAHKISENEKKSTAKRIFQLINSQKFVASFEFFILIIYTTVHSAQVRKLDKISILSSRVIKRKTSRITRKDWSSILVQKIKTEKNKNDYKTYTLLASFTVQKK